MLKIFFCLVSFFLMMGCMRVFVYYLRSGLGSIVFVKLIVIVRLIWNGEWGMVGRYGC